MGELLAVVLLAIVQGATEFLPVSSSGHLSLGHAFLQSGEAPLLLDIVLHVGTLAAVIIVYRRGLAEVVYGFITGAPKLLRSREEWGRNQGLRVGTLILLTTAVTAVLGLALKGVVEGELRAPAFVGAFLLINGVVLWSAPRGQVKGRGLGARVAVILGVLQGLAVTPGLSRSGLTITGALRMGISPEEAARYSFLMSIPAILGALVLQLREVGQSEVHVNLTYLLVGALIAAVVGYLCLRVLIRLVSKAKFHHFAWYSWALGATALTLGLCL